MQRISRRRHTDDFKGQGVALAESASRAKAARQLDIPIKALGNCLGAPRAGRVPSSPNRKPAQPSGGCKPAWPAFRREPSGAGLGGGHHLGHCPRWRRS
ncbi:MAG: hypothetical protein FWD67_06175 [Betaproteobacteria bacterium]|nr:hypothetical protein [Betaproteobacteria bacterium]